MATIEIAAPGTARIEKRTVLVEFTLEEAADGTLLSIVESGFDRIPLARRTQAFRMDDAGWTARLKNLERHVA